MLLAQFVLKFIKCADEHVKKVQEKNGHTIERRRREREKKNIHTEQQANKKNKNV